MRFRTWLRESGSTLTGGGTCAFGLACALAGTLAGGCTSKTTASGPPVIEVPSVTLPPGATGATGATGGRGGAVPAGKAVAKPLLTLRVYQLTLPAGGVSRNEEFWKHVDEQRVDPATYDLLLKNGVRVGVAPNDDWDYFKDILERNPVQAQTGTATAAGRGGNVELTMQSKVPVEDIFYLDDKGEIRGRTYERCENLLGVTFVAEPRHPDEVRVAVTPTVRSLRSHWEYSPADNHEMGVVQVVRDESLYDLNLTTIVPPNSFLVIAPSRESKFPTSLGSTFFRSDGVGEQYEHVLILAPRPTTRIEPTAAAR